MWKTTCKLTVGFKTVGSSLAAERMTAGDLALQPCSGVVQGLCFPAICRAQAPQDLGLAPPYAAFELLSV